MSTPDAAARLASSARYPRYTLLGCPRRGSGQYIRRARSSGTKQQLPQTLDKRLVCHRFLQASKDEVRSKRAVR